MDSTEFKKDFIESIKTAAAVTGEGSCASFVDNMAQYLIDAEALSDFTPSFYKGKSGRSNYRVDGYVYDEFDNTMNLIIADFDGNDLKSGWSRSIIFSEDDKPFLSRWLADARDEMMRSLSAYLSDESVSTETTLVFAVLLSRQRPLALDESICHQLERAIVHHVLNQWFATKQPEESARRQLQYKGAMSAVKSDIRLGCNRRPHRPTNYF